MKYKVKTLRVQGLGKKTYKAGSIVSDACFPEGNAKKLAELGELEAIGKETEKIQPKQEAKKQENKQVSAKK